MRRPRVLLIAYHYPPEPTAGSIRPSALVRLLPEHGWDVDLVTRIQPQVVPNGLTTLVPHEPWMMMMRRKGVRPDRWFRTRPLEERPVTPTSGSGAPAPVGPAGSAWNFFRMTGWQVLTFP